MSADESTDLHPDPPPAGPLSPGVRWGWVAAGLATPLAVASGVVTLAVYADISESLAVSLLWAAALGLPVAAAGVGRGLPRRWPATGRAAVALLLVAPAYLAATFVGFLPLCLLIAWWMP